MQAWKIKFVECSRLCEARIKSLVLSATVVCSWPTSVLKKIGVRLLTKKLKSTFSTKNWTLIFYKITLLSCKGRSVFSLSVQFNALSASLTAECSLFFELVACEHLLILQMTTSTTGTVTFYLLWTHFCPCPRRKIVSYWESLRAPFIPEHNAASGKTNGRIFERLPDSVAFFPVVVHWYSETLLRFRAAYLQTDDFLTMWLNYCSVISRKNARLLLCNRKTYFLFWYSYKNAQK